MVSELPNISVDKSSGLCYYKGEEEAPRKKQGGFDMEEKTTYSDATEAIEVADAADLAPQKKGRKVAHRVFNIIITVLATAAFLFFAVFASALIESYFDMKDFDGEGICGFCAVMVIENGSVSRISDFKHFFIFFPLH